MCDFILAYIDDVNIYSSSFGKHLSHVDIVLGHEISDKDITPTTTKVATVSNFPRPKNLRALRGFLGLAGFYHHFIKDFLTFDELKNRLTSAPILAYPRDNIGFVLYTDISHLTLCAVLSQPGNNRLEGVV
ncbi:14393_t:CDS:2, partial [Cetraspora pellucida]